MKKASNYIFDVDGTLTPSRGSMDSQFAKEFLDFAKTHRVFLVTGSDKPKTLEQVGEEIYNACMRVFNCSGNDVYYGSNQLYKNKKTGIFNIATDKRISKYEFGRKIAKYKKYV